MMEYKLNSVFNPSVLSFILIKENRSYLGIEC